MAEKRIISLLPAATEIVCALGLENQLVGRSHECDYPPAVKDLPVCSSVRLTGGLDSAAIDREVKGLLSESLSIYTIDKEKIRELAPDVVLTQAQCEVCAVSLTEVEEALEGMLQKPAEVISLQPDSLEDIFTEISRIATRLGVQARGEVLVEDLQERIELIRHKLKFLDQKPRVACIEWLSPLMVAGNWTPEMVAIAGGVSVLATSGKHSPSIDLEQLISADPEVIIIMPCGFAIERTLQEISLLLSAPGWNEITAVKNNRVYIADGNHYFNRSGPRIVDSIEILAEIINPKQFIFGFEGEGWVKFEMIS
ncbi:MAG TPA: cobalamin-binding protein [Sphingobacteriaceae bacterium]